MYINLDINDGFIIYTGYKFNFNDISEYIRNTNVYFLL